jgi:hypothetical protein
VSLIAYATDEAWCALIRLPTRWRIRAETKWFSIAVPLFIVRLQT